MRMKSGKCELSEILQNQISGLFNYNNKSKGEIDERKRKGGRRESGGNHRFKEI